jgi:hypothetical protein
MFSRAIHDLDQIQNSSTAHACIFDQSKIHVARKMLSTEVVEELEARAKKRIDARPPLLTAESCALLISIKLAASENRLRFSTSRDLRCMPCRTVSLTALLLDLP